MRPLPSLRALVLLAALGAACKGTPKVGFSVALPSALASNTAWFEIGAFQGASCSAIVPELANGIPDGAASRVAFQANDPTAPQVGNLPSGSYAFAAVAKDMNCAVLATGCVNATVPQANDIVVQLGAVATPTGACPAGAVCQAAECVPANDNSDPSVGAGCSLELLGAGPLVSPASGAGTLMSAPAIVTTPSGFVIVYREVDPTSTNARIDILPIDTGGGALDPARPLLSGRCGSPTEVDGMGLVVDGMNGSLVVARPACGTMPGLELLGFTTAPAITPQPASILVNNATAAAVKLSDGHVAASAADTGSSDIIAFLEDDRAAVATITPNGVNAPSGTFGAVSGNTGAWVAASSGVLALLAGGGPDPGVTPTPMDGGGNEGGGTEGGTVGPDAGVTSDGGATAGATLRLLMVPAGTGIDSLMAGAPPTPLISFPGTFGSVAATGSRVIVASNGSGPGRSVTYRTFDLGGATANTTSGYSIAGSNPVTAVDVAIQGDRVFFVALKTAGVYLNAFDGATTTPRPLQNFDFTTEPRIPAMPTVRDGRVSIAATASRVAVAWTVAKVLGANDSAGGYAVFACTP